MPTKRADQMQTKLIKNPVQTTTHLRDTRPEYHGRIVPWTPMIAKFPYMEPYSPSVRPPDAPAINHGRIDEIVKAISTLTDDDFVSSGPKADSPKVNALTAALGWDDNPVTGQERDAAWEIYRGSLKEATV